MTYFIILQGLTYLLRMKNEEKKISFLSNNAMDDSSPLK